jgi:hypothetical protein
MLAEDKVILYGRILSIAAASVLAVSAISFDCLIIVTSGIIRQMLRAYRTIGLAFIKMELVAKP